MEIAIIGCGKMGEALLGGLLASGTVPARQIVATGGRLGYDPVTV